MQILYDNAPIVASQGTALSGGTIKIHPRSAVSAIWGTTISIPVGTDGIPEQVAVDLPEGDYCVAYCPPSEAPGSRPTCDWIYSVTAQSPGAITPQTLLNTLTSARDYGRSYQELTQLLAACETELTRLQTASEELAAAQATIARYESLTGGDLDSLEITAEIEKILSQGTSVNKRREPVDCPTCEPPELPSLTKAIPTTRLREVDCVKPSLGALTQASRSPKTRRLEPCAKASPDTGLDIHKLMSGRTPVVPEVLKDCSVESESATSGTVASTATTIAPNSTAECDLLC